MIRCTVTLPAEDLARELAGRPDACAEALLAIAQPTDLLRLRVEMDRVSAAADPLRRARLRALGLVIVGAAAAAESARTGRTP